jgi:uncharacterized protein YndB with AHSA1/START domain
MAVHETLHIAAPPALVWSLIDDPARLPLWMPDVLETVYPQGRPKREVAGTRFIQQVRAAGGIKQYDGIVTAFEAERLLAIELTDQTYRIQVAYRLTPDETGTRLDYTGDLTMQNAFMALMATMAWPMTRSILLRQVANLKTVAEAEARQPAQPASAPRARRPATARKTASKPAPRKRSR